jgi:hypothetical protein
MSAKLKVLEQATPPPAPEPPTMAELQEAIVDRSEQLLDALDTLRFKMQYARGDELAALRDEETRLSREIETEPYRYAIARGQFMVAQAMQGLRDVEALRAQADGFARRRDELSTAASKITDPDERDLEMGKVSMLDRKAAAARSQADAEQRNNAIFEKKRGHEKRIAELQAQLEKQRDNLAWQMDHKNDRMVRTSTGESGLGENFAVQTEDIIAALEVEMAATQQALADEERKQVSLLNPESWPDSVRNDCFQTANACLARIQRRASVVRGKF